MFSNKNNWGRVGGGGGGRGRGSPALPRRSAVRYPISGAETQKLTLFPTDLNEMMTVSSFFDCERESSSNSKLAKHKNNCLCTIPRARNTSSSVRMHKPPTSHKVTARYLYSIEMICTLVGLKSSWDNR